MEEDEPFCAPRLAQVFCLDVDGWETPLHKAKLAAKNLCSGDKRASDQDFRQA